MALSHANPGQVIGLSSHAAAARARTTALVKTDAFEVAELVLRAGDQIARHAVPGYATIQCLKGSIILETDKRIELAAGDWLYLARGEEHSVSALQDGSLLMTILFN